MRVGRGRYGGQFGRYGARWTPGHGIRSEVARDDRRGTAPGTVTHHEARVDHGSDAQRPRWDAVVSVTCWCEEEVVAVPLASVRAGRTYTCGRVKCAPSQSEAA